jgi:hypothetical protein
MQPSPRQTARPSPDPAAETLARETRRAIQNQNRLLVKEFLAEFEGEAPPMHITQFDVCTACNESLITSVNGSLLICPSCLMGYPYMDATTAAMSYGEEVEFAPYSYKRVHHFEDWLKKFQAKGSRRVEDEILVLVMQWHRERGLACEKVQRETVRKALKEHGLRKYYDKSMQIYCRITGNAPPCMTPEQENQARLMFQAIQVPYVKWKAVYDPTRRNFLSYAFCLHMFCLREGWHEFLPYFTLLKGEDKLKKQLAIWRGICRDLGWKYIDPIHSEKTEVVRAKANVKVEVEVKVDVEVDVDVEVKACSTAKEVDQTETCEADRGCGSDRRRCGIGVEEEGSAPEAWRAPAQAKVEMGPEPVPVVAGAVVGAKRKAHPPASGKKRKKDAGSNKRRKPA